MPASETLKMLLRFPVCLLTVAALIADAACVARIHDNQTDAFLFGFVAQESPQLEERPVAHLPTHFSVKAGSVPYSRQIFNGQCLSRCSGITHNLFRDVVIRVANEPLLALRCFLQATFCRLRTALLQAPPVLSQLLAKRLDFLARIRFAFRSGSYFNDSQINPQHATFRIGRRLFYVARRQKKPFAFDQNQITFPLPCLQKRRLTLTANKGNFDAPCRRPNRNLPFVELVSQDAVVVRNRAKWLKSALHFLIEFVGVRDFGHTSNNDLRTQFKSLTSANVSDFVKRELPKGLIAPSQLRQIIASGVGDLQSRFQRLRLFRRGLQLELGNQLHNFKYSKNYAVTATNNVVLRTTPQFLHPDKQGGFLGAFL